MGYIYLIYDRDKQAYKIGVTRNINKRIKSLQTGNSTELSILYMHKTDYPFRLETMLHNKFAQKQILNEWYDLSKEDITCFETTCKELSSIIECMLDNPFFSKNLH